MKISIITATFNSSDFLEDCIGSVLMQDYDNIEHIIVDGGSTDGTVDIARRFESETRKWISEKDAGIYDAINKGMNMATGNVIGILNSDDLLASPDVVTCIANAFNRANVDSIYGDLVYVSPGDTSRVLRHWKSAAYDRQRFLLGWMPAHPTFYVRKEVVTKLGGYKLDFLSAADYELMTRYLYRHGVTAWYLEKLIVKMRVGGVSNRSLLHRLRANRKDYQAMRENAFPFPLASSLLKPLTKVPQYFSSFKNRSRPS